MTKYKFLIPVYNDWQSLNLLLQNLNKVLSNISKTGNILVINDGSTISPKLNIDSLSNIKKIELISLNKNLGSQKSIAIGLKYLQNKNISEIITIMDSDGEDDPSNIHEMIEEAENNQNYIITSNRTNRKEKLLFKWLYKIHKLFTFFFSTHWISFGNFSSFHSKNLSFILRNNKVWLAYSSAISINCKIKRVYAKRMERYFGKSKVNFLSLVLHSLRVLSVLQINVILFSSLYMIILIFLMSILNNIIFLFLFFSIIIFNIFLFLIKIYNNENQLDGWRSFINDVRTIN